MSDRQPPDALTRPQQRPARGKRPRQGFLMTVRAGRSVLLAKEGHRATRLGTRETDTRGWIPAPCVGMRDVPRGSRAPVAVSANLGVLAPACARCLRTDPGCLAPGAA